MQCHYYHLQGSIKNLLRASKYNYIHNKEGSLMIQKELFDDLDGYYYHYYCYKWISWPRIREVFLPTLSSHVLAVPLYPTARCVFFYDMECTAPDNLKVYY